MTLLITAGTVQPDAEEQKKIGALAADARAAQALRGTPPGAAASLLGLAADQSGGGGL